MVATSIQLSIIGQPCYISNQAYADENGLYSWWQKGTGGLVHLGVVSGSSYLTTGASTLRSDPKTESSK
jgi:hypothetical protein